MKIAQIAPLMESVPPKLYGGTERIVHYLTEELLDLGHEVTLYASGDSVSRARLDAAVPRGLRLAGADADVLAPHLIMFDRVAAAARQFDILHFHTDYLHFPTFRQCPVPVLSSFHGRLDLPHFPAVFEAFREAPLVSISASQRSPVPTAAWLGTVHHGLPRDLYRFRPEPGKYLAFLGRMSAEKRPDRAIAIARGAGLPLRMAAKVDRADHAYFEARIRPLLGGGVEFIGEVDERDKNALLGGALALLFPIDWPEPFGLVMIEALACGTPVIAFRQGSVPEILRHGETGFIVETVQEAIAAVAAVSGLSRQRCRQEFETRFTARHMAEAYLRLYRELQAARPKDRASGVVGLAAARPRSTPRGGAGL